MATTSTAHRPDLEERRALCSVRVTLNGQPAVIGGARLEFAHVTQLGTGLGCEFAWATVAHIVADRGGRFSS